MLVLAVWIGVLEVKLPRHYRAGGWRAAWVGFDVGLLMVFAATAWAAWRRRQILIVCLMVLATLLCCDAWFDTTLDWGTRGFTLSLLSALLVELPLAVVALIGARRLLRLTVGRLEVLGGTLARCLRSGGCRCSVTTRAPTAPCCASPRIWSARDVSERHARSRKVRRASGNP